MALTAYFVTHWPDQKVDGTSTGASIATKTVKATAVGTTKPEDARAAEGLVAAAEAQRRRNQFDEALTTLARA